MAYICDYYTTKMGSIGNYERSDNQVRRDTLELYAVTIKLKETYNECQYYMSFEGLKNFYETSFFTKSKFCNQLHDHIKSRNTFDLFLPKAKSIYYITHITFCLIFKSNEIKYLLKKALQLEEKSADILNKMVDQHTVKNSELEDFIRVHAHQQPGRISALRKMINTYY
ncbi:hypothetical protein [Galbibacter sp.]|uniref:hypothetical protein n=1 Tax=Galbibacter sp. TaxID=2918471 RepID=UPI002B7C9D6B|nr:hypothetical protein [Galbibacter sp.]HLV63843.1 hypothetical protein [Galbibacter sp.]